MSAVTRPRGPLPARIYWTRRLVLVVVALGLVFGVAHLLGGGSSPSGPSAQPVGADVSPSRTTRSPSPSVTPTPVLTAPTVSGSPSAAVSTGPAGTTGKNGKNGKAGKHASSTPLPQPTGTCSASDIVATPTIKGPAYAGRPVVFAMDLTTRTTPACTFTVSARSLVVKVTSGTDRIWSTQECTGAVPKQDVVVRKDTPASVDVAWNGQRSDTGCTRSTTWAQPGYYHAVAAVFGAAPVDEQFHLLTPVRATITASPTADPSSSARPSSTGKATPKH